MCTCEILHPARVSLKNNAEILPRYNSLIFTTLPPFLFFLNSVHLASRWGELSGNFERARDGTLTYITRSHRRFDTPPWTPPGVPFSRQDIDERFRLGTNLLSANVIENVPLPRFVIARSIGKKSVIADSAHNEVASRDISFA